MTYKIIILFTLLTSSLLSAQVSVSSNEVKNANTVLVTLKEKDINNPKLTFDKHNIKFFEYPNKIDTYYALIPVSYYKKLGNYRIIISYIKNDKKIFKGINIKVVDGKYKSETINVAKGKVSLSKKNKKRTKKEYASAMKIYNTTTDIFYIKDKSIKPINSDITSSFGKKRVYNGSLKSYHSGTDFKASVGTPIKAINDGIVVISEDRFYAGNSIVINHGQGIYSCYFHLSSMNYKSGDYIKKGEIVGLSGSTGRVTGPHLHFSFRVHGIQVDPLQLMKLLNNF
ncbi:M23 family metallopeptidase [Arcobacter sp. LA11]|uniref:M23 family metallopeptidase n=1 Tax=Arcobacter sp. LA11 TaxID=1898176 RepID=UPI0009322D1C|nr:M23 family metallopeptidase [Arcobacter sp. LA11]